MCKHCKRIETHHSRCVAERPNYLDVMKTLTFTEKQFMLRTNEHEAMHWSFCYIDDCSTHLSNKKKSEWYLRESKESKINKTKQKIVYRLNTSIVLCADSDNENYQNAQKIQPLDLEQKKNEQKMINNLRVITESEKFEEILDDYKSLIMRKNSNREWRNIQQRQYKNKQIRQTKHDNKPMKDCFRKYCKTSHKSRKFSISKTWTLWGNLLREHLFYEEIHFKKKDYWTANEEYISSELRIRAKQLAQKYADCKSQQHSINW